MKGGALRTRAFLGFPGAEVKVGEELCLTRGNTSLDSELDVLLQVPGTGPGMMEAEETRVRGVRADICGCPWRSCACERRVPG